MADKSSDFVKVFLADREKVLREHISVPCDVFPYTLGEIESLQRAESPGIKHILQEVIWL